MFGLGLSERLRQADLGLLGAGEVLREGEGVLGLLDGEWSIDRTDPAGLVRPE